MYAQANLSSKALIFQRKSDWMEKNNFTDNIILIAQNFKSELLNLISLILFTQ